MYRWFYEGSTTLHFALFSMVLFMVTFVAVVIRTFTTRHDEVARLPLVGDEGGRHLDSDEGVHDLDTDEGGRHE